MDGQSRAGAAEPASTARTGPVPWHAQESCRQTRATGRPWRPAGWGNRLPLWAPLQARLCRLLRRHRLVVVARGGAAWVLYRCLCCGRVARISQPAGPGAVAEAAMIQRGCPGTARLLEATPHQVRWCCQDTEGMQPPQMSSP